MSQCPCTSGKTFAQCCSPYLERAEKAPTAESLMRARYSAFATGKIDFVTDSLHPEFRQDYNEEETAKWSKESKWPGLKVLKTVGGTEKDETGQVEFVADYEVAGKVYHHHEKAEFRRLKGDWYFVDGKLVRDPIKNEGPKVGRNDPCPCGSGKKHKKCCG